MYKISNNENHNKGNKKTKYEIKKKIIKWIEKLFKTKNVNKPFLFKLKKKKSL